jgi:pSer/pThr/pTyr-binding forkhead associated (FHA) protein
MRLRLFVSESQTDSSSIKLELELTEAGGLIGRSSGQIQIADPRCSRQHAIIYLGPEGKLHIRDLASSNGTFVDGQRIVDEILEAGSEVRIGSTHLFVHHWERKAGWSVPESVIERNEYDQP